MQVLPEIDHSANIARNVLVEYTIGSVVTTRIRRMTGGYVFTGVCLLTFMGGVPQQADREVPPSFPMGRYSIPGQDGVGGTPSQVRERVAPPSRSDPQSGLVVTSPPTPFRTGTGWGNPYQDWIGYLPSVRTGWGYPPLHQAIRR